MKNVQSVFTLSTNSHTLLNGMQTAWTLYILGKYGTRTRTKTNHLELTTGTKTLIRI